MKVTLAVMALIMASMPRGGEPSSTQPDAFDGTLPARYDPDAISAYFNQRPMMVMQRNAIVVSKLTTFAVKLLADWRSGQFEANMPQRARELRGIVESLGPAYIKVRAAVPWLCGSRWGWGCMWRLLYGVALRGGVPACAAQQQQQQQQQ
jgi:hypothetical protein